MVALVVFFVCFCFVFLLFNLLPVFNPVLHYGVQSGIVCVLLGCAKRYCLYIARLCKAVLSVYCWLCKAVLSVYC